MLHDGDGANSGLATFVSETTLDTVRFEKSRWLRDLSRFLPLKSQFVLSGNIQDLQAYEISIGSIVAFPLQSALASELHAAGYQHVLSVNAIQPPRLLSSTGSPLPPDDLLCQLGLTEADSNSGLAGLGRVQEQVVLSDDAPIALIIDYASRLVVRREALSREE